MALFFKGGVHPDDNKGLTAKKPIETLPPPQYIVHPMSMHIGAPCAPTVNVGDRVKIGQVLGDSSAAVSIPVHATVSGKVVSVEEYPHPNGAKVLSVIVENDYEEVLHESVQGVDNIQNVKPQELVSLTRKAGLAGLGGAAFPTHVKISSGIGKVKTLIINGSECEPWLTADNRIMLEYADQIIGGIEILMRAFGVKKAYIGIEANKEDAIIHMQKMLHQKGVGSHIIVRALRVKYPQGAEKQLIRVIANKDVPPGKLPADAGCAVFNVDTAASIFRALSTGIPLIRRIVTVSGTVVANPKNLNVRIGTPLQAVFDAVGGFREAPAKILMGGVMMGIAQHNLSAPVIKGTNGLLAFGASDTAEVKDPVCIHCGRCVRVCPMRLLPLYMFMAEENGEFEELDRMNVRDCIECGCCSYECPAGLPLSQAFSTAKLRLRK